MIFHKTPPEAAPKLCDYIPEIGKIVSYFHEKFLKRLSKTAIGFSNMI